jgi:hypothetical protein
LFEWVANFFNSKIILRRIIMFNKLWYKITSSVVIVLLVLAVIWLACGKPWPVIALTTEKDRWKAEVVTEESDLKETEEPDLKETEEPDSEETEDICYTDFIKAGASSTFAETICADNDDDEYASRLAAGQHCSGWGTIVFDNDSDVEILYDFDAPNIASYTYCYPDGSDIRNAPFFIGAELAPTGKPFDIIFVDPVED